MDRRAAFGSIAAGAAAFVAAPQLALADGAVTTQTIQKARVVYGSRIYDLKAAVEKGDFGAVAEEKNAFVLFNSGAYPYSKDKAQKKEAIKLTNAIFAAIKAGDKAALKDTYNKYVAFNEITAFPVVDSSKGQGYSTDFDYRRLTKAGAIYVR